jgi:hypothetical protein
LASGLKKVSDLVSMPSSKLRSRKAGIPYVVFERDPEESFLHRTRDWGEVSSRLTNTGL